MFRFGLLTVIIRTPTADYLVLKTSDIDYFRSDKHCRKKPLVKNTIRFDKTSIYLNEHRAMQVVHCRILHKINNCI